MAVTSPTSASPELSLMEWDEGAVHSWLTHIGLPQYEELIYEHGITGDVLAVMDHSTLLDLGVASIGHRLSVLRAVWELKREQGMELGDDDWRPQDVPEAQAQKGGEQIDRLWDVVIEQHERLIGLERDQAALLVSLQNKGIDIPMYGLDSIADPSLSVTRGPSLSRKGVGRSASFRWRDNGGRSDDEQETSQGRRAERRASMLFPSSLNSSTHTMNAPRSSDSATFKQAYTPTTSTANYPFDSPSNHLGPNAAGNGDGQKPGLTRLLSGSAIMPGSTNISPPANVTTTPTLNTSASVPTKTPQPVLPGSVSGGPSPTPPTSLPGPSESEKSQAKDAAHSAAKSFRVTLEDPCWKVLPAALKKYKINDDWKLYALFICFGNTERCLSYDEKPLMLFQKLKESGQKPVFMLRHIRDIKSPITVAQQKQLTKLGLPATSTASVLPRIKPATDTSISPTKASTLQPNAPGRDGHEARGFPELPSPGLKDDSTKGGTLVDATGKTINVTYAVAIYPYIADRQDEFDVAVGTTFVIMSKAKGWYIVQKDPGGMGKIVPDQSKSGWVPAGCLLELSAAIGASVSPAELNVTYPGLSPLASSTIISSSYPGVVLMDYTAKSSDELSVREGEKVKVYKKYCHWSYTLKQDTGERGWVPAWFVGKTGASSSTPGTAPLLTASSGSGSLPTTATTQDVSTPRADPSTGSSGSTPAQAPPAGEDNIPEDRVKDSIGYTI